MSLLLVMQEYINAQKEIKGLGVKMADAQKEAEAAKGQHKEEVAKLQAGLATAEAQLKEMTSKHEDLAKQQTVCNADLEVGTLSGLMVLRYCCNIS